MITEEIIKALKGYTAALQKQVTFVVQTGEHSKRSELLTFLGAIANVSDKLSLEERDTRGLLRSAISFTLEVEGEGTGVNFSGIPGGHEFNSLILAVLQAGGGETRLDEQIKSMIASIDDSLSFEIFVSLSCHNCPDVVQTLNQFALINNSISSEMIDGGLYPELIEERDIQGVPCVYLNGELFANGKVDVAQLVDKLIERYPAIVQSIGNELPEQDVTVVGAGPAGVSAAIYAARKGLKVALIADRVGGQVKDTQGIENLISIPKTTGSEVASALQAQMNDYQITLREHVKVTEVKQRGETRELHLSTGEVITTKALILATGARWRELGIPGERENIGNGVAYCPHCDGPFFKGRDVAVIGGGNSGIEAALDLAGIVRSVTVFEFMPELKADQVLVEKAARTSNITIRKNVATRRIVASDGRVSAIEYEERSTGAVHTQELAGIFVQIGLVPNSRFVGDLVETNRHGEIVVDEKCRTSAEGIFACGDVTTVPYKQIVVAMGEGAKASLSAFEYLLTGRVDRQAEAA